MWTLRQVHNSRTAEGFSNTQKFRFSVAWGRVNGLYKHGLYKILCTKRAVLFVRVCAGCAVLFVRQLWLFVAQARCVCGLASPAAGSPDELVQSSLALRVCGPLLPVTGFVQSASSGLDAQQLVFPGASRCDRTESLVIDWLCTHVWIALMP